ncbi:PREDICTED: ankyrin repeat domain-containing protein 17-like [Amphimedon queenslandica]|uniref:Death domain-containing protein n=1 Tax=Amphimedon queenslandica TaxID=400682 RepID=A0AAN0ISG0_AMPQE|nr:PREDICTED: ankyrin repeat domain-containing protein 17-like [Amphimedon queenslandica]|eukprot:XP_011408068.1 PREDICTED: ankyrin repeat domain-containing protein 17-like [Amphimedon queenslandica]
MMVSIIEAESSSVNDRKRKLYSKWLSVSPEATWNDVITALKIRRENTLAQNIKEMIEGHHSVPNISNRAAVGNTQKEIKFNTKENEAEVSCSLTELNKSFTSLMTKVRRAFDKKVASDPELLTDITRWIEIYMNWNDKLTNASLNETFNIIHPYYDFIDCNLIVDLSEEFLYGVTFGEEKINILSELQNHKRKAEKFRSSTNANPHLTTSNGSNALMIASYCGNYEVVELLISKGVDYKYQREDGVNAFMMACEKGYIQIVELLLKEQEQVDPNVKRNDGGNAFMSACKNGHIQIVELLLKDKVDPNVQKKNGLNAFILACQNGHTQIIEMLLKEQVNPDVEKNDGLNTFMLACEKGHTQIVELLLKEQVDFNLQNKRGHTALMVASANGHYEVVKLLLEWKADPTIKSNEGHTALFYAKTEEISVLLQQVDDAISVSSCTSSVLSLVM